jgi:hypothetical protein
MDTKTLIKQAQEFLGRNKKRQLQQIDSIKQVLQKLKKKKSSLKEKLAEERHEKKRARIERELKIISAQRKKGLKAIRKLKTS